MKRHTFKVIQWLGQDRPQDRFAVVEVDQFGPILRDGPLPKRVAEQRADNFYRRALKDRRRRENGNDKR